MLVCGYVEIMIAMRTSIHKTKIPFLSMFYDRSATKILSNEFENKLQYFEQSLDLLLKLETKKKNAEIEIKFLKMFRLEILETFIFIWMCLSSS